MEIESYKEQNIFINIYTRILFFLVGDMFSILVAANIAYVMLWSLDPMDRAFPITHTAIIIGSVILGLAVFRMYFTSWKYTSLRDLLRIILGITVGGGLSLGIAQSLIGMGKYDVVFTVLVLIGSVLTVGGFRISKRVYNTLVRPSKDGSKHTIIFGGESEGEQILRDILTKNQRHHSVQGIFDDRLAPGLRLHGIRVLGGSQKMIEYIRTYPVDMLIVAFPEFPKRKLKEIIDEIKTIRPEMDIKVLPSFHSLTDDPVGVQHIRDISIEDILGREPVNIDIESIKASILGKTVLVTGAGGSIGSELVRQCAKLKPEKLIALDIDETELFHLENELKDSATKIIPCVANVVDETKIDRVLEKFKPDVIFHAAAYKHVPMMESFPGEAIKVNIGGTRLMASLACKHEIDKFILISTDKAVNPANVMGATKRVAEEICMAYNGDVVTKFISVRFGNVLGSRGSVVPLFIDQIKNGGPVTVTDAEMTRYFMTIPEAVLLVMQAGSMGNGGEVFVLDMGQPVKILGMAKDLIRLHGLEPYKDIQIEITGLRPGEKMFEELLNEGEGITKTDHEEINKAQCSNKLNSTVLETKITELLNFLKIEKEDSESVRDMLKSLVPTYSYKEKKEVRQPKKKRLEKVPPSYPDVMSNGTPKYDQPL